MSERKKAVPVPAAKRRAFTEEFRREAVRMLADGHSAASVAERLGMSSPNLLYIWRRRLVEQAGPWGGSGISKPSCAGSSASVTS